MLKAWGLTGLQQLPNGVLSPERQPAPTPRVYSLIKEELTQVKSSGNASRLQKELAYKKDTIFKGSLYERLAQVPAFSAA